MSWAFLGAAISRFTRSQTEHNAGVLFYRRGARARMPRRDETRRDEAEDREFLVQRPCETKDLLFSTYPRLDSGARLRERAIFSRVPGYVTVVHSGRDPDRCTRTPFESSSSIPSPIVYGISMIRPESRIRNSSEYVSARFPAAG